MKKTCKKIRKMNKKGLRLGQIISMIEEVIGNDLLYYTDDKKIKEIINEIYKKMDIK